MHTQFTSRLESTSTHDLSGVAHESLPSSLIDQTQNTLCAQLLGKEAYEELTSLPSFTADGTEAPNAYKLKETPDFSPEGIRHSAILLAAETLPEATIDEYDLKHDIPDNISYQCPPSYETTHLMIDAWNQTGQDDQLFSLIGEMLDFMQDRRIRDELIEALRNAKDTGEDFYSHYELVKSRLTEAEMASLKEEDNYIAMLPHHDLDDISYQPPISAKNYDSTYAEYQERLVSKNLVVIPDYHSSHDSQSATAGANEQTGTMATPLDKLEFSE